MADDYYRPFHASDSEESDAESIDSRPSNANPDYIDERMKKIVEAPNFKAFAASLKIVPPTLPEYPLNNISTMKDERYAVIDRRTSAYPYDSPPYPPTNIPKDSSTSSKVQSVIVLRSRDRDRSVYPQPTTCQLFLPRDYKNVIGFSITDMSLISAFFYFSNSKVNVAIQIFEKDNVYYEPITVNPKPQIDMSGTNLIITNNIREGSYNIIQLLAELNIQLNKVPVFYDFLNGYSDFRTLFQVNGDFSINFNYPGDYYYDSVKDVYIQNPTRSQIVGFYFQSQFANQITFTESQILVAYYYPVLKEALVDPTTDLSKIDFSGAPSGQTQAQTISNLVYSFQGINDPVAYTVIQNNIKFLDTYRVQHTFRYSLVNRYLCTYDQTNNYVSIQANSLNTSLVNLLNAQYNIYLTQQLIKYNLTAAQYNSLSANNAVLQSILQDMYNYLQVNFAKSFAINFGSFGLPYYAVASNTVLIRNGEGAAGIYTSYNAAVSTINTNFTDQFRVNPPALWPRMRNLASVEGAPRNMGSSDPAILFPATSNYPYSLALSNIDLTQTQHFVDLTGNIYTDSRRGAGDILVNVDPGKYTIFQFRSKYRQTLQVETMPRQTNWRYPLWNKDRNVNYPLKTLFDISYCYVTPGEDNSAPITKVTPSNISFRDIQGWTNVANTNTNYSYNFEQSAALWSSPDQLNINNSNGIYYTFQTPLPVAPAIVGSNVYRYPINLTFQPTSNFPDLTYAFLYHDIAAFSADVSLPNIRKESPIHYKEVIEIPSASSNVTFSFKSYANQQYYIILRTSTLSPFSVDYKIVPWIDNSMFSTLSYSTDFDPAADPTTLLDNFNVAKNADSDFIRMPILPSTLWATPSPITAAVNLPLPSISTTNLGYDISGVSNDLTDYLPFSAYANYSTINPITAIRADPITNYIFQYNTPFDSATQSYFNSGTKNAIMTQNALQRYELKNVPLRQYKILNYYATTYIKDTSTSQPNPSDISPYISPYSAATTSNTQLNGYTYLDGATPDQKILQLGSPGLCGFMFLPNEGNWGFDRITFKSCFVNPANDLNTDVHAFGIFITSEVYSESSSGVNLSNALAICLKTSTSVYSNDNSLNIGFDGGLGTYYTYSNYPALVTRPAATSVISGFSQNARSFIADPSSYYSIVAFRFPDYNGSISPAPQPTSNQLANATLTTLHYVTGSPIPYPYASGAYPSATFYDGQSPSTRADVVVANPLQSNIYGPPQGIDRSMSVYEQSIPYVNSHMHYLQQQSFYENPNAFSAWSNLPTTPTFIHASVPNYMLMQNGSFIITKYTTISNVTNITEAQRFFTLKGQLAIQQIFPDNEDTSLIGVSGSSTHYCFLGASNMLSAPGMSQLRFKLYDPDSGILTELPQNPQYTFSNSLLLEHFVFHDTYRWFISALHVQNGSSVLQGDSVYNYTPNTSYLSYTFTNIINTELQLDPTNTYMYFAKYSNPLTGFTNITMYSFDSENPGYIGSGTATNPTTGYQISLETGGIYPPYYTQISVDNDNGSEEVIFLSSFQPNNFFTVNSYEVGTSIINSNAIINKSVQIFLDEAKNPITPSRIIGGANGSKWAIFTQSPYIMGNRNDAYDDPIALNIAWQIFFPTIKIELRKLTNESSPMIDLTNITYPEWPHTAMFAYSNFNSLSNDIGINSATGSWGNEKNTNFMVSDVSFNGFYFNSYMMNIPLLPNYTDTPLVENENNDYYLAVRGWLPTEKFQTMLRFYLPNRYDFGYVRFLDLSGEVSTLQNIGNIPNPPVFSPTYSEALLSFNSNFIFTDKTFGTNIVAGYPGSTITSLGFGDFLNKYTNIYNTFSTNSQVLASIQATLTNSINTYIATDLKYILPPSALKRQRYSDPLLFQIQWKSELTPRFLTIEDEWGLGWNLGYPKQDTPFATIQTAPSFYKIQQSYIYLRLNPEFNINRMDSGGKESYKESREPTGITNQYYCKLLLASFGGNATTFIHNPITFQTPIYRLSKLEFQWIDANGNVISNNDAEWNMSVNITEYIDTVPTPLKTLNTLSNIV